MSQTTPDVTQLSPCCGEPLEWKQDDDCHEAHCSCGAVVTGDGPERELMPTEDLLLARIAEMEDGCRWHVAAGVKLVEDNNELRARIAELEATLANERGEGEAPCEGWEWWRSERAWALCKDGCGFHVTRTAKGWTWDADRVSSGYPHFNTARDAMRAASGAPDAHP